MQQITDEKAAELVLGIIPRMQFQGNELQALVALQNWALYRSGKGSDQPEFDFAPPSEEIAAE